MLVKYVQTLGKKIFSATNRNVDLKVLEAPNGKIALERIAEESVDMIFLDLMMPEMDGLTFLDRKRQNSEYEKMPVIVCSAVGEDDVVQKARDLGAASYVTKPFKLKALETEFRRTVESYLS